MMELRLSGDAIADRDDLHNIFYSALGFPQDYQRNLDALYDCLIDVSEPVSICLDVPSLAAPLGQRYLTRLQSVLREAAMENPRLHIII